MTLRTKSSLVLSGLLVLSIGTTGGILLYQSAQHTREQVRARSQLLAENRAFALHDNFEILALELARGAQASYPDGAALVKLAPVTDGGTGWPIGTSATSTRASSSAKSGSAHNPHLRAPSALSTIRVCLPKYVKVESRYS